MLFKACYQTVYVVNLAIYVQNHPLLAGSLVCVVLLVLWRLWAFTLVPLIRPNAPKPLPYWIPYLGHTVPFLRNSEELLTYARHFFGNKREPFAITLAGSTFYVISDPHDVTAVYKASSTLSFDIFLHEIMAEFGSTRSAIRKIFQVPKHHCMEDRIHPHKNVSQLAHDFQLRQARGGELQILGSYIREFFQENLLLDRMPGSYLRSFIVQEKGPECVLSLKLWTAEVFINAGQKAYFGDRLSEVDPTLPHALMALDELSWQVFYQYPRLLRPELNRISEHIRRSLTTYFEIPMNERRGQAWFTQALETEYRRVGLNTEDIAAQMLFLYWGINTNVSKVCFWIIAHVLFTPGLIDMIRAESEPAFETDGTLDSEYVYRSCPGLNGLWFEALRVSAASTALRFITEDTWIGGKILQKGNKLMVSARQLHFNDTAFGEDVSQFDATRFLKDPRLQHSPSFRPFGGGMTLCPGRSLAKHMVLTFIALIFRRFDINLARPQRFPRYEESKPAIGITTGNDDLILKLRERNR